MGTVIITSFITSQTSPTSSVNDDTMYYHEICENGDTLFNLQLVVVDSIANFIDSSLQVSFWQQLH